jgi:hypothetical protein
VLVLAIGLLAGVGSAVGAVELSSPFGNPHANLPPPSAASGAGSPCTPSGGNRWAACNAIMLRAINAAQVKEHERAFTLPANFLQLSAPEQLFVWVNLERISRGVPPLVGLSRVLDLAAAKGVNGGPRFQTSYGPLGVAVNQQTGQYAWSAFAGGGSSMPMAAGFVFELMYDDGWGGAGHGPFGATLNNDCNSPHGAGCWKDRDELLGSTTGVACRDCVAGAAGGRSSFGGSFALMIVQPTRTPVALDFTWNSDVLPHLPAGYEHVRARPPGSLR